jgi:hypothetical protein
MALATQLGTTWAVLDIDGRVIVLFQGEGAWAEAQEWASRGYVVAEVQSIAA